jgi:hypothetical protein
MMQSFKNEFKVKLGTPKKYTKTFEGRPLPDKAKDVEDTSSKQKSKKNKEKPLPWYEKRDCDLAIDGWLGRTAYGTLLLTGYRGVGKSSCVDGALSKITSKIKINFTTAFTLTELSMLIVKDISEKIGLDLVEGNSHKVLIKKKSIFTQLLEYLRSRKSKTQKELESLILKFIIQASAVVETVINDGGGTFSLAGNVKDISMSATLNRGATRSQKNLFYQMTESEIVFRLNEIIFKYVQLVQEIRPEKVVFIFDEIDKLKNFNSEDEKSNEKIRQFEELIEKLKYIFTNSKATYIFIAGREIYYRWQIDKSRGNSIYSSVFDHVLLVEPFLGCDRSSGPTREDDDSGKGIEELERAESKIKKIIRRYLSDKYSITIENFASDENRDVYKSFIRYLLWKSRGIPRKLLQELEYFIQPAANQPESPHFLYFDTARIQKIKVYSGLVKELYSKIVINERLDNDGILNLIILTETLFKFHRTGFNYSDLKWITVSVDQEVKLKNEYFYDLAIKLLEGWWVETSYGKKARYVFKPHSKAAINILSTRFEDESVAFKFEKRDFKNSEAYFSHIDQIVEDQSDTQRINSIRIEIGMAKINALLGEDFQAIEYYKKAIRLGIIELDRERKSVVCIGNVRVLTRAMADSYLEIGHILEKQRGLRDAMSFYLSAFSMAYKSHEYLFDQNQKSGNTTADQNQEESDQRVLFDIKKITGNTSQDLDSYFCIGEEGIDALTHVAYIQWKFGKFTETEALLLSALDIAKNRRYPYKIASQTLLLGFFFFRSCNIGEALRYFYEIVKEETPLPDYIINSTHEAISCCLLSEAKSANDLMGSFDELEKIFCRVDFTTDLRQIIEYKLLQFRLYQRKLRLGDREKIITDPTHAELLNDLFLLVRKRSSDADLGNENPISIRLYFHLTGMVCWHIFSVITHNVSKDQPVEKLTEDVQRLFKNCHPFFKSIAEKCLDANNTSHDDDKDAIYSYLLNKKKESSNKREGMETGEKTILEKLRDNDSFDFNLSDLFVFLEQVFLLCYWVFQKHIFTEAASDPADRLGYFYFWIYSKFNQNGNVNLPELRFYQLEEKIAEQFFNWSISDQKLYKAFLPDQAYPNITTQLYLGDIYYLRFQRETSASKFALQQKCLQFYTIAILSLAKELQLCFTNNPLMHTIFYKETKMIPRLRMYDVAEQRYNLRMIFLRKKEEINKGIASNKEFFSKFPTKDKRNSEEYELNLDNPDSVGVYCAYLQRVANTKRESTKAAEDSNDYLSQKIDLLMKILEPWRYKENLTRLPCVPL